MGLFRFILAMSVLLKHLQDTYHISFFDYQIVGGQVAVVSFFILSGFYMSLILNEKYTTARNSYKLYITNRFLRIFPLYWIVLAITIPVITLAGQIDIIRDTFETTNVFLNILNFSQSIIQNITLFVTVNAFIIIPEAYSNFYVSSAWSLSIEMIFYLLAPFLVKGSTKRVILLFILAELARIYVTHINLIYPIGSTPFLFIPNLPFFLLGALSYRLYKALKVVKLNTWIYWVLPTILFVTTITFNYIPDILFYTFKQYLLYSLIFLSIPFLFIIEKHIKFDKLFGDLSYPIYISHLITLVIANYFLVNSMQTLWLLLFDVIIVILVSYVLKIAISDRIDLYREKRFLLNKVKTKVAAKRKRRVSL